MPDRLLFIVLSFTRLNFQKQNTPKKIKSIRPQVHKIIKEQAQVFAHCKIPVHCWYVQYHTVNPMSMVSYSAYLQALKNKMLGIPYPCLGKNCVHKTPVSEYLFNHLIAGMFWIQHHYWPVILTITNCFEKSVSKQSKNQADHDFSILILAAS